jgi:putative transposase
VQSSPDRTTDAPAGFESKAQTAAPASGHRRAVHERDLVECFGSHLQASSANCKWVADFTYIWTAEGWLYVAAVVDLFSRRVVGWSMSATMTAQMVTDALIMAIWRRGKPNALLHHSDRGSQYTSEQFQRADHGVTCSMSRAGNCWDNAAMESFFSSLKTERTARKTYRTARTSSFHSTELAQNPHAPLTISVNLSTPQFDQLLPVAQIKDVLHETGIDLSRPR